MTFGGGKGGYFDMTSERLGEIFEGDSADVCAGKFLLMLMGGRAEDLAQTRDWKSCPFPP